MTRQVEYHPEAKKEIQETRDWYDDKVDGLGLEFLLEVKNSESKIVQDPDLWPIYEAETRRFIMNRFPYAVIYLISERKVQIVAVAHYKRKPGYWKNRLGSLTCSTMKGDNMRIPFGTVTITQKSKELINEALDSNRLSTGKYVKQFEERFAELVGTKEAVALSSGTDADALALAVLHDFGANRGDEIIVPALSFVATGNSVLQAGFIPTFVDIDEKTLNIDIDKIEERITERTRAIMPVHLMGKPSDMDSIMTIARKYNLYVIEDAAEAHGAVYKGRNVGAIGDMAAYSLYVAHIITTIEGGIVTTDREDFAEILRSLRSHGRACKCKSCVLNTSSAYCNKRFQSGDGIDIRFQFERIGYSCKMNELEAAIGLGNLDIFDEILEKKRKNLLSMIEKFERFDQYLYTITEEPHEKIGPHAFPIILKKDAPFTRNQLVDFMEKKGVDTRSLFLSMPTQCPGFAFLKYKLGEFPVSEYMGNRGIHIGVHQDIDEEQIEYVMDTITAFLEGNT